VVVDSPASVATGDLLIANIAINGGSPANVSAPSGWTQILRTDNDTNVSLISYYKVAGASEPANYTWTIDTATRAEGGITQYKGVDTSNPIDVALGNFSRGKVATTSSITTSSANEEVVDSFAFDAGTSTTGYFSTPTGMTEKYDVTFPTVGPSLAADDTVQVSAGTVGSVSTTIAGNKNRNWASQAIALHMAPTSHISIETGTNGPTSGSICSGTPTSLTFSKTVSSTSTLLTVHAFAGGITGVTYAGVSMTNAISTAQGTTWYLVNPSSGTHDVVVNMSPGAAILASAVSYTGTDTTNPIGATATSSNQGATSNPSLNITTTNDNSVIDDNINVGASQTNTANSPQVEQSTVICGATSFESHGASTLQTTGHGSYSLGWTPANNSWFELAAEVNAAQ
jgi:hypothetical protein